MAATASPRRNLDRQIALPRGNVHACDRDANDIPQRKPAARPATDQTNTARVQGEMIVEIETQPAEAFDREFLQLDETSLGDQSRDDTRMRLAESPCEKTETLDAHGLALGIGRVLLGARAGAGEGLEDRRIPRRAAAAAQPFAHPPVIVQVRVAPDG